MYVFIYLSVYEHFDCFHFLTTTNNAPMNIHSHVLPCTIHISFFLDIYLGLVLLNHMANLCLTFKDTSKPFP